MMKAFRANSYLFGGNAPYIEELYESYLNNPGSVPEPWRAYFDGMQALPAADGFGGAASGVPASASLPNSRGGVWSLNAAGWLNRNAVIP